MTSRSLALSVASTFALVLALPATAQYSVSSAPGSILIPSGAPGNTGGGGTWATAFPPALATQVITMATPIPAGATNIERLIIGGAYHTWIGDLQIVLNAPSGARYNAVHRIGSIGNAVGHSVNLGTAANVGANYTIVDPADPSINQSWPIVNPGSTLYLPTGVYPQEYGALWGGGWVSGTLSVNNTSFSAIPIESGIWSVTVYDWAGGDVGFITSVTIEGDTGVVAPPTYCTAGTSTNGCVPSISANVNPSASLANSCVISVSNVEGQKSGIVFYGINNSGFTPTVWGPGSNSFLCVKASTQRMVALNSGGTVGLCDGVLTQSWNAFQTANPGALGNPFSAGNKVYSQAWYRDPTAVKTTNLSNALDMTLVP